MCIVTFDVVALRGIGARRHEHVTLAARARDHRYDRCVRDRASGQLREHRGMVVRRWHVTHRTAERLAELNGTQAGKGGWRTEARVANIGVASYLEHP